MSERRLQRTDGELNVKAIVAVGLALLLATAAAGGLSWWLAQTLRERMIGQDPPPPVLLEAQAPYLPPTPNLQIDSEAQLRELRSEEAQVLGTWGWSDSSGDVARVPIERGMELLLETRPDARAFEPQAADPESTDES